MKLTTKGRYAVTAMLDLAMHADERPIPLSDISSRRGISLSYLEQLFAKLRRDHLVKSIRGPGGGYQLNQPAHAISIAEVMGSVDESTDATACAGAADCQSGQQCLTHDLWCQLSDQINGFLSGISLQSVIDQKKFEPRSQASSELSKIPFVFMDKQQGPNRISSEAP